MSYYSIGKSGRIVLHKEDRGKAVELEQDTYIVQCERCLFTSKSLRKPGAPAQCICGGMLQWREQL